MLAYYLRLALKSLRRNPVLTALMIGAIALGVGVCITTLTVYRLMSGNPIAHRNDVLYAVTLDSWDPNEPWSDDHPELPPPELTYRDAHGAVRVRHPGPQGDHAQGQRSCSTRCRRRASKPFLVEARTDDQGFLRDVRRAVPVRRRLGPGGGRRLADGRGAVEEDQREGVRRRRQRRPARCGSTGATSRSSACSTTGRRRRSSTT